MSITEILLLIVKCFLACLAVMMGVAVALETLFYFANQAWRH